MSNDTDKQRAPSLTKKVRRGLSWMRALMEVELEVGEHTYTPKEVADIIAALRWILAKERQED